MEKTSIHQYFEDLKDPRIHRTRKHPLINILFIALCAVIGGAEDWVAIERFGKARLAWLKRFLDLAEGIPSHDTFSRVFALLDSSAFAKHFMIWAETLADKVKKVIAVDGKTLRGTRDQQTDLGALHLVNVWCCENKLVLGQEVVSDKSNEITAIPSLLALLDIKGAVITIDAMGAQKTICDLLISKEADYVLSLKGNQGNLHKDVALYFQTIEQGGLKNAVVGRFEQVEKDHGRLEERRYRVAALPAGIAAEGWRSLRSIVHVHSKRTSNGQSGEESRYFISSLPSTQVHDIVNAVRCHWQVENNLHWQLDVSFHEDNWRSKQGNIAANMALLNKVALNLLKKETTSKVGIKNRRLLAGWDETYLAKVIVMAKN